MLVRECSAYLASLSLLLLFISQAVWADSQRIIDYEYDSAGNISTINANRNLGPPDVTNLSPSFLNKESITFITVTGNNLSKTSVSSDTTGLTVFSVNNVSNQQIIIGLLAESLAETGLATLNFVSRVGSDTESIVIAERTPIVSTNPNPILLEADNQSRQIELLFDEPFTTDQTYEVLVQDESIASINEQTITLLAGEREVALDITGLSTGSTALEINQFTNFLALSIPIIVADPFQLPAGELFIASKPFGVTIRNFDLPTGQNQVLSRPFGVTATNFELTAGNNQALSKPLGLTIEPIAEQVSPRQVARGSSTTLVVTGASLNGVTTVSFISNSGITQTASFSANTEGTMLSIFVDIDTNATTGLRQVVLTDANGAINFSIANGSIFEITN